jgi:hypothetical protein
VSQEPAITENGLIANVMALWHLYYSHTLNKVWLLHQQCMTTIIDNNESNHYRLPHMAKDFFLAETGQIPFITKTTIEAEAVLKIMGCNDLYIE